MSDNRAKILERLRALRAKTVENGCTEGEAMAAAEKVEQWLREYAISRDELDQRSFQEAAYEKADFKRDHRLKHPSIWLAINSIAELCECKMWWPTETGGHKGLTAQFFGEEQDVEMAIWLAGVVEKGIEGEWFVYSFANPTADYRSFADGCAYRIHERLRNMRLHSEQFVRAAGKALVVQTKAMIRQRRLDDMGLKFKTQKLRANNGRDYWSGHAAGNNVTFHQGVRNSGGAKSHPAMPLRLGHG